MLLDWRVKKRAEVLAKRPKLTEKELAKLAKELELNPQQSPFSNKTNWTLRKVYEEDHTLLEENFRAYINGFSKNVDDIIEHFNYRATIGQMAKNNRLAPILNQYKELELGPDKLSALEMGYIYEELLRRFSEQSGEEAGEHFTPREVIRLMVELLEIPIPDRHISIYDPACGTGGMLSVAKEHLLDRAATPEQKERVEKFVTVHGHELSPTNYAICQADLLIKNDRQAKVYYGNSLIPHDAHSKDPGDQRPENKFRANFMLSNPPFGVTWGGKDGYEAEARKLEKTRYQAGMPRSNDGALLFLETMLAKMQPPEKDGSRIAIIFNGSPLSNGDCGAGESEIRRWILENDWLDAIVMLPDQLFYNTGIFTYIWLLRNEKPTSHRGRVMLIDARQQFEKEPKSFGNKRNRMTDAHRQWIEERYRDGWKVDYSDPEVKFFRNTPTEKDFAYHKVSVVFWQTDEHDQPAMVTEPYEKAFTTANLSKEQAFYDCDLTFRVRVKMDGKEKTVAFVLKPADNAGKNLKAALGDRPETVSVEWTHHHYVQDDEYIPQGEDIEAFLNREIAKPIIRWKDRPQLGYEILPNKYFYRYQRPMPAKELLDEFWRLEKDIHRAITLGLDGCTELKESGLEWVGRMPSHWSIRRIKDIAELRSGDAITSESITPVGDYPVYGGNGLRGYTNSFNHDGHYVLIGRQGALCGNINYAIGRFWASEHAVVGTLAKKYDTFWFGELLRVMNLNQYSNADAQPGLAVDRIKFLRLPVPPPEEQARIGMQVREIALQTEEIRSQLEKQIATLTAYRKSLIHECVTGQRRVTEEDVRRAQHGHTVSTVAQTA